MALQSEKALSETGAWGSLVAPEVNWRQTLYAAGILVVLPTVFVMVAWNIFGFVGPAVNLDFALLYIGCVLWDRVVRKFTAAVALIGLFGILFFQVLSGAGLVFLYDVSMVADYLQFARYWPWPLIGAGLALTAVVFAFVYAALRRVAFAKAGVVPGVGLLALILGVNFLSHSHLGYTLFGRDPVTSSAYTAFRLARDMGAPHIFTYTSHPGPSVASLVGGEGAAPQRILSISVEALGLAKDPAFNDRIAQALVEQVSEDYTVERTTHLFQGLTIAGELRELCGVRIAHSPRKADAERMGPRCLPARLKAAGYETTGLHGNNGFFYMRNNLYKGIGFDHELFYSDLVAKGGKVCPNRAFPGVCDRDVLTTALQSFGDAPKDFVHVMTLDTHFPLGAQKPGDSDCAGWGRMPSGDLCLYGNQFSAALRTIGSTVRAARIKPDVIYIYGDHAPPYIVAAEREFFSRDQVPFIVLTRRSTGTESK